MGAVSTAATLVLILYIVFFVLRYLDRTGLVILSLVFVVVDLALIIDFFIHRLYNFHINAMVINIMTSPAAADSIQLGLAPYVTAVGVILFLIAFQWGSMALIKRLQAYRVDEINKKMNKLLIIPLFMIILIEKVSFGMATAFSNNEIVSKFAVIPLYQPLTFNRAAHKYFGIEPKAEVNTIASGKQEINYPLEPLSFKPDAKKTNIFIFASDAVRNSAINDEIAPNVSAFARESYRYQNHISGGNATRFGVFSLMYGINSTYWFKFLSASKGSILFDALESLGYQINISSSTSTQWPEFRQTCYVDVASCIHDEFEGTPAQKDALNSAFFETWLSKQDKEKPIFSFVFWDAPHGRSYPDEYKKFLPDGDGKTNYLNVDQQTAKKELYNQYKNAVYYNDALFGQMIQTLKDNDLYDDSIIIFTSDHGQEFYEYGNFGHNSAFSRPQVNSPFIIKLPGEGAKEINTLTSHVDIVPTLMRYIGVETPVETYSNGKDLFAQDFHRDYTFVANWNYNAIYTDEVTMIFSNLPNKIFNNEVRNTQNYAKLEGKDQEMNSAMILSVLNENKKFLK